MPHKARSLFVWILASALALSAGWLAFQLIGSPLGSWVYGVIIWGLLALGLRQANFSVAKWAVAGSIGGLILGFEGSALADEISIIPLMSLTSIVATFSLPIMALPLLLMFAPLGIILALNFFFVPRPGKPPRKFLIAKHTKSILKMALVWITVCAAGGIIGTAVGFSFRAAGIAFGWSDLLGFTVGSRFVFGIIVGAVTGLAALNASRSSMLKAQE